MLPLLLVVALQAPLVGAPPVAQGLGTQEVLRPDTTLRPPSGVDILLQRTPGGPVVALHLTIELDEGASEAGLAAILAEMARTRTEGAARRIGARLEATRTTSGISYTVAGAAEELDYLAWLLRQAAGEPPRDGAAFERARSRVRMRVARSRETPAGVLNRRLMSAVQPEIPHPDGELSVLDGMHAGMAVEFWNRTHQADRMTLVAVGDVAPVTLLALTRDLGAPPELAAAALTIQPPTGSAPARPQVLRSWYAQAHRLPVPGDIRNRVLVVLADRALARAPAPYEMTVELWELRQAAALVVGGGAHRAQRNDMEAMVSGLVAGVRGTLTPLELAEAVAFVRDDLLFQARTPWGRARLMGTHAAALDDPGLAAEQLRVLQGMDITEMLAFLDEVLAQSPISERVRP